MRDRELGVSLGKTGVGQAFGVDDHFFFENRVEVFFAAHWQGIVVSKEQETLFYTAQYENRLSGLFA